jgi:diadenosine tetraphosphate (Ap4A) HIT family hydrolase
MAVDGLAGASEAGDWALHPQLAQDCDFLGDLGLCRVLLMQDANYPWLILVPRRSSVSEIVDLTEPDRICLMAEIAQASSALRSATLCDKLNVASLGNAVPQLHVHVIARFRGDPAWPRPVWGQVPPRIYAEPARRAITSALQAALDLYGPLSRPRDP